MNDPNLWTAVQRITYPRRSPSSCQPFPKEGATPKRRPASWLYHLLLDNHELRAKVLP